MSHQTAKHRPKRRPTDAMAASDREANKRAALILEVLAGVRTAAQAAAALSISTNHYYLLERKALTGLLTACQPQPKGKRPDAEKQLAALERELARCRQECQRQAALVRAMQRTVGVPLTPPPDKPKSTRSSGKSGNKLPKKRRRSTSVRALRAAQEFNQRATVVETRPASPDGAAADENGSLKTERHDGT